MKRLKRVFLPAVLVLCMVLCMFPITANAEATTGVVQSGSENAYIYSAALVDSRVAKDGYYLLVVFRSNVTDVNAAAPTEMPSFTADDIIYIDQITAEQADSVVFTGWAPSTYAGGQAWIIGTGGVKDFVGWLLTYGIPASGLINNAKAVVAELGHFDADNNFVADYTSEPSTTDTFTFSSVPEGTYALRISKNQYLTFVQESITVSDSGTGSAVIGTDEGFRMYGGDLDGDTGVNFTDLTTLLGKYNTTEVDLDDDGACNFNDLSILLASYGESNNSIRK